MIFILPNSPWKYKSLNRLPSNFNSESSIKTSKKFTIFRGKKQSNEFKFIKFNFDLKIISSSKNKHHSISSFLSDNLIMIIYTHYAYFFYTWRFWKNYWGSFNLESVKYRKVWIASYMRLWHIIQYLFHEIYHKNERIFYIRFQLCDWSD